MVGKEVASIRSLSVPAPRGRDSTEAPVGTHHRRALFYSPRASATPDSGVSVNDSARPVILAPTRLGYAPVIQATEGKPE